MEAREVRIVQCTRCGNKWATRIDPKRCSKCKSQYWATPRTRKRKAM